MFYEPSLEVDTFLTEQWLRPVHMNALVKITFYWNWTFLSATGILALFIKLEKQLNKEEVECKICFKKMNPYKLKKHMGSTHAEKKHSCEECGKCFSSNNKLQIHNMNVHLKLRPYKCRYGCALAYNDSSNRCAHEKRVHGRIFKEEN